MRSGYPDGEHTLGVVCGERLGGPPDGTETSAVRSAVREQAAYPPDSDGTYATFGHSSPSLSQPGEEKAAKEGENGSKTDTEHKVHTNAVSAVRSKKAPLTAEQVEVYKRAKASGKSEEEARSIARGEMQL